MASLSSSARPRSFFQPHLFSSRALSVSAVLSLASGCVHYSPKPLVLAQSAAALEARSLSDPGLQAFIAAHAGPSHPSGAWDLESLTLAAVYFNPTLAVARAQWQSATAGKATAAARPNPVLSLSAGYNQSAASGMSPWFPGLSFDLPFETAGKRGARISRADATIESSRQTLFDTAWLVRHNLRAAWLDTLAADGRARLLDRQAEVQGRVTDLLQQRLTAGVISIPEMTSARLSRQRANYDAGEAHRLASSARARLAEAIGVPLAAVRRLEFQPLPESPPALGLSAEEARAWALHSRPDVLVALAEYQGAEADLRTQVAKQYPDIHVIPGFQWDQGERKWSLGGAFELPLFNRNRASIAEAEARREELALRVLAAQARALAELDAAFENHAQVEAQLDRARQVYRTAEEQRTILENARNSGDTDALQSESALLESLTAQLIQLDTLNAWHAARGQLEDAVRQPLSLFIHLEKAPEHPER